MKSSVTPEYNGVRLDKFVKKEVASLPLTALFRLLRKKRVRLNGRVITDPKTELAAGDELVIEELPRETRAHGGDLPVLFEDEHLLVVDKPRGLAVHSGAGKEGRTVIALLRARASGTEPHLAHRLDKYTSGVLVTAKDRETSGKLGAQFKKTGDRETKKTYITVVFGRAERADTIDKPLDGKKALTHYRCLRQIPWRDKGLSLLEVRIDTGRLHQIRRHLAAAGLPVAGDDDYGNWELNKQFQADYKIKEYLLHAWEVRLRHPVSEMMMTFRSPVPEEFKAVFGEITIETQRQRGLQRKKKGRRGEKAW